MANEIAGMRASTSPAHFTRAPTRWRKKEDVLWRSWDREGGGFDRVSQAGHLTGLENLPRSGLNIEAKPFVLGGSTQARDESGGLPRENELDFNR